MDQGGEMDQKPAIMWLFDKYSYTVRRTDPDASHQNYPDEGPTRYIGESFSSIMEGHQVPTKLFT